MTAIVTPHPLPDARAHHRVGPALNRAVAVEAYDIRVAQAREHAALVLQLRRLNGNKRSSVQQERHQSISK
jgi:hypothetical protein